MKILIVEDEKKTRDGLQHIIEQYTAHTVIGAAADAQEGIRMACALAPDLIITDIQMPGQNGLRMLEELQKQKISAASIILSGFSDFEYARGAIKLGVQEYLLKPVTVEDLNECFAKIEQQLNDRTYAEPSVNDLLCLLLSSDPQEKDTCIEQLKLKLRVSEKTQLTAFLVKPQAYDVESHSEITNQIISGLEVLCLDNCYTITLPFDYGILILCVNTEKNKALEQRVQQNILVRLDRITACLAASVRFYDLSLLEAQIKELRQLLFFALTAPAQTLITKEYIQSISEDSLPYPSKLDAKMRQAVYRDDAEQILSAAGQFKNTLFSETHHPAKVLDYTLLFLSNAYAASQECTCRQLDLSEYQHLIQQISSTCQKEKFIDLFDTVMNMFADNQEQDYEVQNLIILKVIHYIRQNYHQDISLTQLADKMDVTPEYLSKLFNKEMNINFSTFLKNFRISAAKRLILSGEKKIQEVAEEVGFSDPKYFNRVFREVCGQSPSEFRKQNR